MTDKTEGLEVVGEVRAKSDAYGGTFVLWKQLPIAGMQLVTLASAQAAVAAERKRWEDATLAIKAIGDANADSDCARITALESALGVARDALLLPVDRWNKRQFEIVNEALVLIDTTLGGKQ